MSIRVYISYNDVDTEWPYSIGTLQATDSIEERNTFSVGVRSLDGTGIPLTGQPIRITDDTEGNLYGGTIEQVRALLTEGCDLVKLLLQCASWDQLTDRHVLESARTYTEKPAGQIIKDLFLNTSIVNEGVYLTGLTNGPTISVALALNGPQKLSSCISDILQMCPGYAFKIDAEKTAQFYALAVTPAPFSLTRGEGCHLVGAPEITWSREKYANKYYLALSNFLGDSIEESFLGDGTTKVFNTKFPISYAPTIIRYSRTVDLVQTTETFTSSESQQSFNLAFPIYYTDASTLPIITVDDNPQNSVGLSGSNSDWMFDANGYTVWHGAPNPWEPPQPIGSVVSITYFYAASDPYDSSPVPQTVGLVGDTGKQWYWQEGSTEFSQDVLDSAMPVGDVLKISYKSSAPSQVSYENTTEVTARAAIEGGTGIWADVFSSDQVIDYAQAQALVQSLVEKYSKISVTLEGKTHDIGLKSGQGILVTFDYLRLSDDSYPFNNTALIIQTVNLQDANGVMEWSFRAVGGAIIPYGYKALAEMMSSKSKGSTNISVTATNITNEGNADIVPDSVLLQGVINGLPGA